MGVQRVLEATESGRAFLQEHGLRFEKAPRHDNDFAALRSARRREVAREVDQHLRRQTQARVFVERQIAAFRRRFQFLN